MSSNRSRSLGPHFAAPLFALAAVMLALLAPVARAQAPRPWSPPVGPRTGSAPPTLQPAPAWSVPMDSLARVVKSARLRFERAKGDSLGGDNFDGYQITGDLGRRLLVALGRGRWGQAGVVQHTLDSLGLDVEVSVDATMPGMVFMLARNPFRPTADAVGFLYWMLGDQVLMQGASYPASIHPVFRAWHTGAPDAPYEAVTLFHQLGAKDVLLMRLYRMDATGQSWGLVQYEGNMMDLGTNSHADFTDVNFDGRPELVVWKPAPPDSFLEIRTDAPPLVEEYLYTERPEGFVLHDVRALPGPVETVHMFSTLLVQGEVARAKRLLMNPDALDSMVAAGWGRSTMRGAWTIEYGERGQAWPEWLELKVRQDSGWKHWIFHFYIKDGRWVIRDWIPVRAPNPANVVPVQIPPAGPPPGKKP